MIAAIAIDRWKLTIFDRHLSKAGYTYTQHPGLVEEMIILKVNTPSVAKLAPIVEAAQKECKTQ